MNSLQGKRDFLLEPNFTTIRSKHIRMRYEYQSMCEVDSQTSRKLLLIDYTIYIRMRNFHIRNLIEIDQISTFAEAQKF